MPHPNDDHQVFSNRRSNGQFRPGKSGNPSGRPKKSLSTQSVFRAMLMSKVSVLKDGKRVTLTVVEAMAERVKREALAGPLRGLERGIAVAQKYSLLEVPPDEQAPDLSRLSDEDLELYGMLAAKLQGLDWETVQKSWETEGGNG